MSKPTRHRLTLVLVIAVAFVLAPVVSSTAANSVETDRPGIAFRVRTLVGVEGARRTITDATVDGPPGTDVTLDSRAGSFTMHARLKTDVLVDGRVHVVATVTTRRSAGTSERGLPLFEEDVRDASVDLATDGSESLVVLPFGRNPGREELAVDVEPRASLRPTSDPLAIRIDDAGTDGWMRVDARAVPHRFSVDATIERAGVVVASGRGTCGLDEAGNVRLVRPDGSALAELRLSVTDVELACPADRVAVAFDMDGPSGAIARAWSGSTTADRPLVYALGDAVPATGSGPTTLAIHVNPMGDQP